MFDWPEQIHTSPTRTSSIFTVFSPETFRVRPLPLDSIASSLTIQPPSGPATALLV